MASGYQKSKKSEDLVVGDRPLRERVSRESLGDSPGAIIAFFEGKEVVDGSPGGSSSGGCLGRFRRRVGQPRSEHSLLARACKVFPVAEHRGLHQEFSNDTVVKKSISSQVVSKYLKLKKRELKEFSKVDEAHKANWIRKNIIDC